VESPNFEEAKSKEEREATKENYRQQAFSHLKIRRALPVSIAFLRERSERFLGRPREEEKKALLWLREKIFSGRGN